MSKTLMNAWVAACAKCTARILLSQCAGNLRRSELSNLITMKKILGGDNYLFEIEAPLVAGRLKAGQFVMLMIDKQGERVPLTVADTDLEKGTIKIIFQVVGKSTMQLSAYEPGDSIMECIGPLGRATEISNYGRVVCIGGGTGIACILPIVKALSNAGNEVVSIIGARTCSMLILEDEICSACDNICVSTDDGSKGQHGLVTDVLRDLIDRYPAGGIARVYTIGPPIMMKAVAEMTGIHKIKTIASLNSIMLDGTGMCGSCRVFVNDEMKLACIDGPEFDAHQVNFDDLISRLSMFSEKEKHAYQCYLEKQKSIA